MIKVAPVLIEFGDGDTGARMGLTDDGEGCMALFNGEPGEIGRTLSEEPKDKSIGAYIVFKNIESIEAVIRNFQRLRDLMATESTPTSNPIKRQWVCNICKWHVEHACAKHTCDGDCPNINNDGNCKCLTVSDGDPCPYYEKWEVPNND